jgi:hypothetical protein
MCEESYVISLYSSTQSALECMGCLYFTSVISLYYVFVIFFWLVAVVIVVSLLSCVQLLCV